MTKCSVILVRACNKSETHSPCRHPPTLSPPAGDHSEMPTTVLSSHPTTGGTVHQTSPNSLLARLCHSLPKYGMPKVIVAYIDMACMHGIE